MACGLASGQILERGGQARIDAGQGTAIGFVLAVFALVGRAFRQRLHLRRNVDQQGREREFAAQVMDLGEVVAQRDFGLTPQCVLQGLRAHVGVAVAVAAYPLAHAQEAGNGVLPQLAFQISVELGDLAQKGRFVVAQRVFHFVCDCEFGGAQQARLPQLHHARTQQCFVGGQIARRHRVLARRRQQGAQFDVVACCQRLCDVALGVQNALALHFRGMRREHGRHIGIGQRLRNGFGCDAGPTQARQRHFDTAFLRVAGALVHGAAADMVAVFRQIGEVAEVGEGADHAHGLVAAQTLEQLLQALVGLVVRVATKRHRELANLLHQFKRGGAFLFADHVAQNAAQQPDVFYQGALVFLGFGQRCTAAAGEAARLVGAGDGFGQGWKFHGIHGADFLGVEQMGLAGYAKCPC